ncbi:hypothetical protein CPY51_30340 [Rhizobium tubonense]|uniref:Signal transduction histidine kinase dimerisation/phosphoacceptor domain-containing protein n=1 Tax=Rhizobium tubonense TaxID=484088 RepID=A0A2W4C9K4_9HYPH|nr:hypothetical protein CPY51_30340 [Rhizobium tubonense]
MVHEIEGLIGLIAIGVHANMRWLDSSGEPNVERARQTTRKLVRQTEQLMALIEAIRKPLT